jgi:hypothetical protein
MLRSLILPVVLALVAACGRAEARLFWQTYGATAATADGCGCAWNVNQDYFVPRHCHTGRYGLFSACKSAHTISPACKNLHPVYAGYCTPYGSCRYKWRDHVYRTYCGCGPLKNHLAAWHLRPCGKHPLVLKHVSHEAGCCSGEPTGAGQGFPTMYGELRSSCLCNVEPFGGEILGSISALTSASTAAPPAVPASAATVQRALPQLNLSPNATPGSSLPPPFNF